METEPMFFKALWLLLFRGLHGGEFVMFLETRSLCVYLLTLWINYIETPYRP